MVEETLSGKLERLSVDELERLSSRHRQMLRLQRQQVMGKEERLKGLMSQFHRHEQKLDSLRSARTSFDVQEVRLRELRQLKAALDRQTASKNQLSEELEKTKALFSGREKELAEAVAKVDILTQQLDRTRAHKMFYHTTPETNGNSSVPVPKPTPSSLSFAPEIERLKQEQRLRSHALQQQKRKIDDKDSSLLQKTLQRNELDQRINDIAERLQKRRTQPDPIPSKNYNADRENQYEESVPKIKKSPNKRAAICERNGDEEPGENRGNLSITNVSRSRRNVLLTDEESLGEILPSKNLTKRESSVSDDSAISSLQTVVSEKEELSSKNRNLPSLVTDTLMAGDPSSRFTGTPDTSSASSVSEVVPAPDTLSSKANHRHHSHSSAKTPIAVEEAHPVAPLTTETQHVGAGAKKPPLQVHVVQVQQQRRVKFDPQALLLDASLEGELELVIKTCQQVMDPSASNDEGITALHNAICAGHFPIVKFLVEYGCDVNAQDSDGWSPLHCAASCNNLDMCRFLIEHGACIYATTNSDHETAAAKCEEDEADYEPCSEYLEDSLKSLGRINDGVVFAVYNYEAQNGDELSFKCGDKLRVLRTGDESESEWYWAELLSGSPVEKIKEIKAPTEKSKCGYIPRNLLALHPRVQRLSS